jgi:hypothetical protein
MARLPVFVLGQADKTVTARTLTVSLIIVVIVGVMIGYVGRSHADQPSKPQVKVVDSSDVIEPSVVAMEVAPETSEGAARAVTSFITGLPGLSLEQAQNPQDAQTILDSLMDPDGDPAVATNIHNLVQSGRNQLVGSASLNKPVSTSFVFTPVSYHVDALAKDRMRVQVWMSAVEVDNEHRSTTANWSTTDITVRWVDHWRISNYSATEGPTPTVNSADGNFSSYDDVVTRVDGFSDYWYAVGNRP